METRPRNTYTFSTWNVRGLTEKKRETFAEIERENEDVVVLSETKIRGSGKEDYGNYVHFYSGVSAGPSRAGISILLKRELCRYAKWEAISERIIKARMNICGKKVVVVGVYWVDDCAQPTVKDRFQETLKTVVESVKKDHELLLMGDFNARVGTSDESKVVGKFGDKEVNNNGRRLLEFCENHCLKIQNTFFDHEDIHKYTWYHARNSSRTLIDYCITRQKSSVDIVDVLACRWLDCGTDHIFLETTIAFPRTSDSAIVNDIVLDDILELRKYKTYLLYSKTVRIHYKEYLEKSVNLLTPKTTDEIYECLKNNIHLAAFDVLGIENKDMFGEFLWDEEIRKLRSRRDIKIDPLVIDQKVYDFKEVKNQVWEGICNFINNASKIDKTKIVWSLLKELQNYNQNVTLTGTETMENVCQIVFKNHRITVSKDIIETHNNCDEVRIGTFMRVETTDVINAINKLEDYSGPTPGGLTISLLRHSNNKSLRLLTNLIQAIFDGGKIPPEITESYIMTQVENHRKGFKNNDIHLHSIMRIMGALVRDVLEKNINTENNNQLIYEESAMDAVYILRLLLQKNAEKQNGAVHLAVVDLGDTYIDIELTKLYATLERIGIGDNLLELIKHLYKQSIIRIAVSDKLSNEFYLRKGLLRGSCLSSTLFKIYVKNSLEAWSKDNVINGVLIKDRKLYYILSNNHFAIVSDSAKNLEAMVVNLQRHLKDIGLHLPLKRVKYLGDGVLKLGRTTATGVDAIDYQGVILELAGRNCEEIHQRILETKMAIGVLHPVARDETVSSRNKKQIFKSIIRCILTHGCETWTLTDELKKALESVDVSYWKWCCEDYPRRYTKQEIYELLDIRQSAFDVIMLKKTGWYAKICQIDDDKWSKIMFKWNPKGTSRFGRPRKKWVDGLDELLRDLTYYHAYLRKNKFFTNPAIESQQLN